MAGQVNLAKHRDTGGIVRHVGDHVAIAERLDRQYDFSCCALIKPDEIAVEVGYTCLQGTWTYVRQTKQLHSLLRDTRLHRTRHGKTNGNARRQRPSGERLIVSDPRLAEAPQRRPHVVRGGCLHTGHEKALCPVATRNGLPGSAASIRSVGTEFDHDFAGAGAGDEIARHQWIWSRSNSRRWKRQ